MHSTTVVKHILWMFLLLFIFAAIPCILHFVFQLPLLPTGVSDDQDIPRFIRLLGYIFLSSWYVFFIYGPRLIIPTSPSVKEVITKEELIACLRKAFLSTQAQGKPLFELEETANQVVVKWNQRIDYSQLTSIGYKSVNYLVSFEFVEPKKTVLVHTIVTHTQGSAGITGAVLRMNSQSGMVIDAGVTLAPSFHWQADGTLKMDIEKMRYSNSAIINPAVEIFQRSGWDSRFVMFKHTASRIVWSVLGWLLFTLGILTILLGLAM